MWNFLHSGLLDPVFVHKGACLTSPRKVLLLSFVLLNVSFVFTCGAGSSREREWGVLDYCFSHWLEMHGPWDFDIGGQINLGCTAHCFPKCPNINCVS